MEQYNIEPYNENQPKQNFEKEEAYLRAKKRVDKLVGFYWHVAVFIVVNIFLVFVNYWTYWEFKWFWMSLFGWGIGLLIHFLGVFGPDFIFGKDWEDKKIQEFMEEDLDNNFN